MSGYVYNRFKYIKLPEAMHSFWGSRICSFVHGLFSTIFAWGSRFVLCSWTVLHDICMDHAGDGSHGTARLRCFYDLTVHMGHSDYCYTVLGAPDLFFVHGTVLHDICMDHAGDGSHGTARLRCFYDLTVHMGHSDYFSTVFCTGY